MFFAAWTWTWVLGALALTSGLVVLIHMLRLRRRRREVAYLPLFEEALGDAAAAKRVDWIRRLLALLLSLGIVTALALSLGDPRFGRDEAGRSVVLLIDQSLSMDAVHEGRARLDHAKEEARRLVRGLGRGDVAAVVAMGDAPVPASPLTDDIEALDHAIDAIPSGAGGADLDAALALAADILAARRGGEIVLLGDRAYPPVKAAEGLRISGVRVGESAENLAIETFSTRRVPRDPSRASVLLRVANHGSLPRRARVELRSRSELIEAHDLELPPRGAETLSLDDVPVTEARVEARLVPTDDLVEALQADDVAHAAIAPRPAVHVHVVTPGNLFLEAALLLDATVRVTESAPGEALPGVPPDLYVFDRALPPTPVRRPALYVAPPDEGGALPVRLGPVLDAPFFDSARKEDPLVAGLRLRDVNIARGRAIVLDDGDTALGRSGRHALLGRGARDGVPFVVMGFAVEESDLPLRATWPLLLLRVIDHLSRRDVQHTPPNRVGRALDVTLATRAGSATWTRPNGTSAEVRLEGEHARLVPAEPGVHTLAADDARSEVVVQRAATGESRLEVPESLTLGEAVLEPPPEARPRGLARPMLALLAFAALLLGLEHLAFHRRWIE